MQGYIWAKTPEDALFVVLMVDGKGYVPGIENAINMAEVFLLEPVQWPTATAQPNPNLAPPKCGALAPAAIAGSAIRLCVVNG